MFFVYSIKMLWKGQGTIKMMSSQPPSYIHMLDSCFPKISVTVRRNTYLPLISSRAGIKAIRSVGFHTSPSSRAPPPQIWEIVIKVLRMLAINEGRNLKHGLPGDKRQRFGAGTIAAGGVVASLLAYLFYVAHLEECPITKRKKFVVFSEKLITQMAKRESDNILRQYRGKVTRSGEAYKHVLGISARILKANNHLPGIKKDWRVFVIEDRRILNAFVLPNGDIFIFTGMMRVVSNEDQLAAVMGHEIAHALLNHVGELISKTHLLEFLLLLPIVIIWIMLPDAVAISSQNYTEYISELLFKLPMSRQLETEADVVGLKMMARACYDPRQAVQLWKRMANLSRGEPIEWLSTHPSHKTRYSTLDKLMPEAFGIYSRHCKS